MKICPGFQREISVTKEKFAFMVIESAYFRGDGYSCLPRGLFFKERFFFLEGQLFPFRMSWMLYFMWLNVQESKQKDIKVISLVKW